MVWLILLFLSVVIISLLFLLRFLISSSEEHSSFQLTQPAEWEFKNRYKRRNYLFDSAAEFNFYKILLELFGDQYYIFPQVGYSHLVEPNKLSKWEYKRHRSKIDKKSADFVFCDKVRMVPQLVLELDGVTHGWENRKERDFFIDELMKDVGLLILHIQAGTTDKLIIKNSILNKLAGR